MVLYYACLMYLCYGMFYILQYISRIRIGVGVSPDTSKEYLRTFVFDHEHIEEKGPGVSVAVTT